MYVLKKRTLIIAALSSLLSAVIAVFLILSVSYTSLSFSASFYYVCYLSPTDSTSVSSVSGLVQSYGAAGYIVNASDEYFVALACYYTERDAISVSDKLTKRGVNCSVKEVTAENFKLKGGAKKYEKKYESNLTSLLSVSKLLYSLSNSLDNFSSTQSEAKSVLSDIITSLNGLLAANSANCFSSGIKYIIAECASAMDGYILSGAVRRAQIAATDTIANINIY